MVPIFHKLSKKEFLNTEDTEKYKLGLIYAKKNSTNFYKLIYYTIISIIGFYVLYDEPYFPKVLFGNGDMKVIFKLPFPECFYLEKPNYFNLYYLGALAFHVTDLIWLLGVYELQSDFVMMLVHHICTISLITFSYLSNYFHGGSIILFLHDFGDIFSYIARLSMNTSAPEWSKLATGILVLLVWIYTRIYALAFVIWDIYLILRTHWSIVNRILLTLQVFLYILHCFWVYMIFKKILDAVFAKKYSDTFKIKKVE
jgi:hypothetical protein